jgi:hypothetical protein
MAVIMALFAVLIFAPAFAQAEGLNLEVGQQLTPGRPAPYMLVRYNWYLARIPGGDLWLLPELGAVAGDTPTGYARAQLLLDTVYFTVGIEARAGDLTYARVFVRFDL